MRHPSSELKAKRVYEAMMRPLVLCVVCNVERPYAQWVFSDGSIRHRVCAGCVDTMANWDSLCVHSELSGAEMIRNDMTKPYFK